MKLYLISVYKCIKYNLVLASKASAVCTWKKSMHQLTTWKYQCECSQRHEIFQAGIALESASTTDCSQLWKPASAQLDPDCLQHHHKAEVHNHKKQRNFEWQVRLKLSKWFNTIFFRMLKFSCHKSHKCSYTITVQRKKHAKHVTKPSHTFNCNQILVLIDNYTVKAIFNEPESFICHNQSLL